MQQNWSVRRLRQAVRGPRAGDDLEALVDPAAPPPVAPTGAPLPPGRLITRAERWAEELDGWGAQWEAVKPDKLPRKQRARLQAAVAQAQARLARPAAAPLGA